MVHHSPDFKHHVLTHYSRNTRGRGFLALAQRYGVPGGPRTIRSWHERWDGTPSSLTRRPTPGRPRALTRAQAYQYVTAPIRRHNRRHMPIHYQQLHQAAQQQTGRSVSIQTIRRYGHNDAGARLKRTHKRTAKERKHNRIRHSGNIARVAAGACTEVRGVGPFCVQCLLHRVIALPSFDVASRQWVPSTCCSWTRPPYV